MTPEQIAEAQQLSREFAPPKEARGSSSDNPASAESPTASGTGFFITEDGYLISNYHVVKDAAKVRLLTSAGTLDAKVMQVDAANDLALLKAEGKFSALPVAASRAVSLEHCRYLSDFPISLCRGSRPNLPKEKSRRCPAQGTTLGISRLGSVPVQPGNSGGALVDDHGNVVGIVSAKLDVATALAASGSLPENVNYAVKSSFLLSFLESGARRCKENEGTEHEGRKVRGCGEISGSSGGVGFSLLIPLLLRAFSIFALRIRVIRAIRGLELDQGSGVQLPSAFRAFLRPGTYGSRAAKAFGAGTNHLRHVAARQRGRGQSATGHHPVAGHVKVFQARQRVGNAPAQNAGRGQPAFVTALPVAGIAHKRGRRGHVGMFQVLAATPGKRLSRMAMIS